MVNVGARFNKYDIFQIDKTGELNYLLDFSYDSQEKNYNKLIGQYEKKETPEPMEEIPQPLLNSWEEFMENLKNKIVYDEFRKKPKYKKKGKKKFARKIIRYFPGEKKGVKVGLSSCPHVYKIKPNTKDLSEDIKETMSDYNYFIVEMQLNVLLGREFKIPSLRLHLDLICDSKKRTAVNAFDVAPDDKFKKVTVIEGKINLNISKMLTFIPGPIGKVIAGLLPIEINPIPFKWTYDKYMIDTYGAGNWYTYWKIYETRTVQSFRPTIILKAEKNIKLISTLAKCEYKLKKETFRAARNRISRPKWIKILG